MKQVWVACPSGPKIIAELPGSPVGPQPIRVTWTEGLQAMIDLGVLVHYPTLPPATLPEPDRILGVRDETAPR